MLVDHVYCSIGEGSSGVHVIVTCIPSYCRSSCDVYIVIVVKVPYAAVVIVFPV